MHTCNTRNVSKSVKTPSTSPKSSGATSTGSKSKPKAKKAEDSLQRIPGVGPKYEKLFQGREIHKVSDLVQLHYETHQADEDATREFILKTVGIRNSGHMDQIVNYLKKDALAGSVSQQEASGLLATADSGSPSGSSSSSEHPDWSCAGPRVTLSVEGNISAGKSTFLKILESQGVNQHMQVVPEPVDKWQSVGDGKVNLLMEFYREPTRYAYTFQNYVFLTRVMQERDSYTNSQMCRLLERSVFSDRMVFVRAVHAAKFMSDTELAIYDSWFTPVLNTMPTIVPNGFIYLRAGPQTCHRRMLKRARSEEGGVQLDYLQELHERHEDWLWAGGSRAADCRNLWVGPTQQLLVNSNPSGVPPSSGPPPSGAASVGVLQPGMLPLMPEVPSAIRDNVLILDTNKAAHMHPRLHHIPALVLDCDTDVDVERDEEYKAHVANQVRTYVEYVKSYKTAKAQFNQSTRGEPHPLNGYYLRDELDNVLYRFNGAGKEYDVFLPGSSKVILPGDKGNKGDKGLSLPTVS